MKEKSFAGDLLVMAGLSAAANVAAVIASVKGKVAAVAGSTKEKFTAVTASMKQKFTTLSTSSAKGKAAAVGDLSSKEYDEPKLSFPFPTELREKILDMIPHDVGIDVIIDPITGRIRFDPVSPVPNTFNVDHNARNRRESYREEAFAQFDTEQFGRGQQIFFNPNHDTAFIRIDLDLLCDKAAFPFLKWLFDMSVGWVDKPSPTFGRCFGHALGDWFFGNPYVNPPHRPHADNEVGKVECFEFFLYRQIKSRGRLHPWGATTSDSVVFVVSRQKGVVPYDQTSLKQRCNKLFLKQDPHHDPVNDQQYLWPDADWHMLWQLMALV